MFSRRKTGTTRLGASTMGKSSLTSDVGGVAKT
jgi:hypothetical protein